MRSRFRLCIAALAAVAALPASATTYYYCAITDYYKGDLIYFTPMMSTSVDDVDEEKTSTRSSTSWAWISRASPAASTRIAMPRATKAICKSPGRACPGVTRGRAAKSPSRIRRFLRNL